MKSLRNRVAAELAEACEGQRLDIAMAAVLIVTLAACGAALNTGILTVNDIGKALCKSYYGEHPELRGGKAAETVCAIDKVVAPFVDGAFAARAEAAPASTAALAQTPR
jgi:hypothetical protein